MYLLMDFRVVAKLARQACGDVGRVNSSGMAWTFLGGVGSVLELFPPPERFELTSQRDAIDEDWAQVTADLWQAIGAFEADESETSEVEPAISGER